MTTLEIILICWILMGIINFTFFALTRKWSKAEWSLDIILMFYIIPIWGFITMIVVLFNGFIIDPIKNKRQKKVEGAKE